MIRTPSTLLALTAVGALAWPGLGCAKDRAPAPTSQAAAAAPEKAAFGSLSIPELEAKLQAAKAGELKLAIYDNNSKERFAKSHLPGAKWVNYQEYGENDLPQDKATTLVFYCANEH
jgi:hypothetical protein